MRRLIAFSLLVAAALAALRPNGATSAGWSPWAGPRQPVAALAVAPSAPHLVYAVGGASVLRSADGAETWRVLPSPTDAMDLGSVAVDPLDASVVYIGNRAAPGAPGLYRSADSGQTWQVVSPAEAGPVSAVAVAAAPAHRVTIGVGGRFPASRFAVRQSDDDGAAWREVWGAEALMGAGAITSLAPLGNGVLAGALTYHGGGLVRVTDNGGDWLRGETVSPLPGFVAPGGMAGAVRSSTLYVLWSANGPFTLASLRATEDGGQTWRDVTPPLRGRSGQQAGQPPDTPWLRAVTTDSAQPATVFASGAWQVESRRVLVVMGSWDGGATWAQLGEPLPVGDIRALAYSAPTRTVLAATDQGVWQYSVPVPSGPIQIAPWFRSYYLAHDGLRLLGEPLEQPAEYRGYPAQLFEKGRVEDHSAEESDPAWRVMYGLLVDELLTVAADIPVGGDRSTLTYAGLADASADDRLVAPPPGFSGGTRVLANGNVFIPLDPQLRPAPGHTVPPVFWAYINRADLFPGGWLHDIGLPVTEPLAAVVDKGDVRDRPIMVQAFQRTVLTYDPANDVNWRVERANVGSDYLRAFR